MIDELAFEVLLCGEYEKLLDECQRALDHWNVRSERIRQTQQTGEEAGGELLQATGAVAAPAFSGCGNRVLCVESKGENVSRAPHAARQEARS